MRFGLQTHFNALIGRDLLRQVRDAGFTDARIDALTCSVDMMLEMVDETLDAELVPLVIVADPVKLLAFSYREVPAFEWANEPDGDIQPRHYRAALEEACAIAAAHDLTLWAPAISNLSQKPLRWLNKVRDCGGGWPAGLYGISAHSYGPFPHKGFATREGEVKWLKAACAGLPFIITEAGLPSIDGVSEEDQAAFWRDEWQFWQEQGAEGCFYYQLNDGLSDHYNDHYGIRRVTGEWKPSAYTVPN